MTGLHILAISRIGCAASRAPRHLHGWQFYSAVLTTCPSLSQSSNGKRTDTTEGFIISVAKHFFLLNGLPPLSGDGCGSRGCNQAMHALTMDLDSIYNKPVALPLANPRIGSANPVDREESSSLIKPSQQPQDRERTWEMEVLPKAAHVLATGGRYNRGEADSTINSVSTTYRAQPAIVESKVQANPSVQVLINTGGEKKRETRFFF
jgi:hypothetical protein